MGESVWRRPVTELSSYPTELEAHVTLTDPSLGCFRLAKSLGRSR